MGMCSQTKCVFCIDTLTPDPLTLDPILPNNNARGSLGITFLKRSVLLKTNDNESWPLPNKN